MTKNFYASVYDTDNDGRSYAYMIRIASNDNLKTIMERHPNLQACNIAPTKKEAAKIVDEWNHNFKNNGTYMFDNYPFC